MARETSVGRLAMAVSILFAAGTLAACGDEGTADGGGTTGGSTTGGSTTGGSTTGGSSAGTTGGTSGGSLQVNGCTSYQAMSGTPTIDFPGSISGQFHFVPNCISIGVGQSVTFSGTFSNHPLNPGVAPSLTTSDPSSPSNPITRTATGTSATFAFPTAGTYGMYCEFHQSLGMYGAIQVQ